MWQFDVKKGREEEFEKLYGADGDWTALNRQTRSYLGSSFLHDQNQSSRYLLIEYWSEMIVYEQHRTSRSAMMDAIETRRAELVNAAVISGGATANDSARLTSAADRHGGTAESSGLRRGALRSERRASLHCPHVMNNTVIITMNTKTPYR